jgi:carnosine N-methyltransferase
MNPPCAEEEAAERASFLRVIHAFRSYEADALAEVVRWEANHGLLPPQHKLASQEAVFAQSRAAVASNAAFIRDMLSVFEGDSAPAHLRVPPSPVGALQPPSTPGEAEKVRYVLRNLVRDWSSEGAAERQGCYAPLLAALASALPPGGGSKVNGGPPRVLVPGAGLGRLCCELVAAGYSAEGNEWSHYMLIASR